MEVLQARTFKLEEENQALKMDIETSKFLPATGPMGASRGIGPEFETLREEKEALSERLRTAQTLIKQQEGLALSL